MIHWKSADSSSQKLELVRDCNCTSHFIQASSASQYGFAMRGTVHSTTTAHGAWYGYLQQPRNLPAHASFGTDVVWFARKEVTESSRLLTPSRDPTAAAFS